MANEKKLTKSSYPTNSTNIAELLMSDFANNDLSTKALISLLPPIDLAKAARTSQFFLASAKADTRWEEAVKERFAAHPILRKIADKKHDSSRFETYKEMYQRLDALYVEIRKELLSPIPRSEYKAIAAQQKRRLNLFAKVVENGFDKFADYFPNLRPQNINVEVNDSSFLIIAALNGQTEFVRQILNWGGRVTARNPGYFHGGEAGIWEPGLGNDALIFAASRGYLDCMRLLIENPDTTNRANIDSTTPDFGITALHVAAERGHVNCVEYLLARGARTNIRENNHKQRALEQARNDECRALIQAKMLERGESAEVESLCTIL